MTDMDREDLSPEEQEAFDQLPRERIAPAALEDRVVGSLRSEGLLGRNRRRPLRSSGWIAAAMAAGVALFASGLATGQWMASRSTADVVSAVLDGDPFTRALQVQQAGSEYVSAVARLSDLVEETAAEELAPGREAARSALHAAALELGRLTPDDATIQLVLAVLEQRSRGTDSGTARTTFWF